MHTHTHTFTHVTHASHTTHRLNARGPVYLHHVLPLLSPLSKRIPSPFPTSCPKKLGVNERKEKLSLLVRSTYLRAHTHGYSYTHAYTQTDMYTYIRMFSNIYILIYVGIVNIGNKVHRRVHTDTLHKGPSTRRGRYLSKRGRCESCFASAPPPRGGGKKVLTQSGGYIPLVNYACDVCRVHLCRDCFHNKYDHSTLGKPAESVILM